MSTTVTSTKTFHDLGLAEATLHSLEEMGYEQPTPVQQEAVPLALAGNLRSTAGGHALDGVDCVLLIGR